MLKQRSTTKNPPELPFPCQAFKRTINIFGLRFFFFSQSLTTVLLCALLSFPGILSLPPGNSLELPHIKVVPFFLLETFVTYKTYWPYYIVVFWTFFLRLFKVISIHNVGPKLTISRWRVALPTKPTRHPMYYYTSICLFSQVTYEPLREMFISYLLSCCFQPIVLQVLNKLNWKPQ